MALSKTQKPKIPKEVLEHTIKHSVSWSDLSRKLRGNDSWGNIRTMKRYASYYKLDTTELDNLTNLKNPSKPKCDPVDMFVIESPYSATVLARYYRRHYPAKECSECGIGTTWNGKPLTLQIDHVNGHGTDWRLENCRYLCPNCHYQTDTHGTKRGVAKRIASITVSPEELSQAHDEMGSYIAVGKKYGMSDRSVKNIIRKFKKDQALDLSKTSQQV
jgi:5-methylcytosine-specific restriction endonuclease McrA